MIKNCSFNFLKLLHCLNIFHNFCALVSYEEAQLNTLTVVCIHHHFVLYHYIFYYVECVMKLQTKYYMRI